LVGQKTPSRTVIKKTKGLFVPYARSIHALSNDRRLVLGFEIAFSEPNGSRVSESH
jgi:hypothetical protein